MINIVQGIYPDIAWDVLPKEQDGKLSLPAAKVEVADKNYNMAAASFNIANGTVYLTPGGYIFVAEDQVADLSKFQNKENYWVCAIKVDESNNSNVMVLKAVKS